MAWVVEYNIKWVNEINKICCKTKECEVTHDEMIDIEIKKALMVTQEHGFRMHLKWVIDRGLRLRAMLPCLR